MGRIAGSGKMDRSLLYGLGSAMFALAGSVGFPAKWMRPWPGVISPADSHHAGPFGLWRQRRFLETNRTKAQQGWKPEPLIASRNVHRPGLRTGARPLLASCLGRWHGGLWEAAGALRQALEGEGRVQAPCLAPDGRTWPRRGSGAAGRLWPMNIPQGSARQSANQLGKGFSLTPDGGLNSASPRMGRGSGPPSGRNAPLMPRRQTAPDMATRFVRTILCIYSWMEPICCCPLPQGSASADDLGRAGIFPGQHP